MLYTRSEFQMNPDASTAGRREGQWIIAAMSASYLESRPAMVADLAGWLRNRAGVILWLAATPAEIVRSLKRAVEDGTVIALPRRSERRLAGGSGGDEASQSKSSFNALPIARRALEAMTVPVMSDADWFDWPFRDRVIPDSVAEATNDWRPSIQPGYSKDDLVSYLREVLDNRDGIIGSASLDGMPLSFAEATPLSDALPFEYSEESSPGDILDLVARGVSEAQEADCFAQYELALDECKLYAAMTGEGYTYVACKAKAFADYNRCRGC